ncbi:NAD(P)/FAD-dependent oxidoreductase, partial [Verrucomicrobiales bacterium]|nr:NAD(P)/FAD-dependent oxidoreductase [Verrucomicrobiales bacterium]
QIGKHSPFPHLPKRLWSSLLAHAKIPETTQYSQLPKTATRALATEINAGTYHVTGKSTNKDEFVTCGGVSLKEISPKTFASHLHKNLHFVGEILDIDGITGGFNFQNAWTSGHLAGTAVAESIQCDLKQRL